MLRPACTGSQQPEGSTHQAAENVTAVATLECGAASRASGSSSAHTIQIMQPAAKPRARGSRAWKVSTNSPEPGAAEPGRSPQRGSEAQPQGPAYICIRLSKVSMYEQEEKRGERSVSARPSACVREEIGGGTVTRACMPVQEGRHKVRAWSHT
eukprot:1160416-Pelagomonas_calceolata.AAC.8